MGYEFIESKDISTLLNKFTTILHVESAEKTFFTLQSVHGTELKIYKRLIEKFSNSVKQLLELNGMFGEANLLSLRDLFQCVARFLAILKTFVELFRGKEMGVQPFDEHLYAELLSRLPDESRFPTNATPNYRLIVQGGVAASFKSLGAKLTAFRSSSESPIRLDLNSLEEVHSLLDEFLSLLLSSFRDSFRGHTSVLLGDGWLASFAPSPSTVPLTLEEKQLLAPVLPRVTSFAGKSALPSYSLQSVSLETKTEKRPASSNEFGYAKRVARGEETPSSSLVIRLPVPQAYANKTLAGSSAKLTSSSPALSKSSSSPALSKSSSPILTGSSSPMTRVASSPVASTSILSSSSVSRSPSSPSKTPLLRIKTSLVASPSPMRPMKSDTSPSPALESIVLKPSDASSYGESSSLGNVSVSSSGPTRDSSSAAVNQPSPIVPLVQSSPVAANQPPPLIATVESSPVLPRASSSPVKNLSDLSDSSNEPISHLLNKLSSASERFSASAAKELQSAPATIPLGMSSNEATAPLSSSQSTNPSTSFTSSPSSSQPIKPLTVSTNSSVSSQPIISSTNPPTLSQPTKSSTKSSSQPINPPSSTSSTKSSSQPPSSTKSSTPTSPVTSPKPASSSAISASSDSNSNSDSDNEDEYPHHAARVGNTFQAVVKPFDAQLSERERRPHAQQERLWDPDRLSAEDLESFTSIFPADLMEKVYEVIVECDYDLDRAYKELTENPPLNPITRFNPEDEKRLEDNIDNLPMVHRLFFPYARNTEVVDLYYHMDASFKDDICTMCSGAGSLIFCSKCPRGFHKSCIKLPSMKEFICPFCLVNKESLSSSEIEGILSKYRHYINGQHAISSRSMSKRTSS
ncbi:hypothetical protein WA588_003889 [Blastocystis sp. NMH]